MRIPLWNRANPAESIDKGAPDVTIRGESTEEDRSSKCRKQRVSPGKRMKPMSHLVRNTAPPECIEGGLCPVQGAAIPRAGTATVSRRINRACVREVRPGSSAGTGSPPEPRAHGEHVGRINNHMNHPAVDCLARTGSCRGTVSHRNYPKHPPRFKRSTSSSRPPASFVAYHFVHAGENEHEPT